MADQKTAVITGATSGLGQAAALALAKQGWRVLAVGRDPQRGAEVVRASAGGVEFVAADLFTREGVLALAAQVRERAAAVDLLVNNAGGVFSAGPATADGLEATFALNVRAPHALTEALLEPLAAAKGRVVNVVTGIQRGFRVKPEQLRDPGRTSGMFGYMRCKLALLALTRAQQARWGARGVTFVALHPGIIPTTRFGHTLRGLNPFTTVGPLLAKVFRFGVTEEVAAQRYVTVGTGPVEPGGYYYEGALRPAATQAEEAPFGDFVWSLVAEVPAPARAAA